MTTIEFILREAGLSPANAKTLGEEILNNMEISNAIKTQMGESKDSPDSECRCNKKANNSVSHPSHYVDGRKYEPKDVIRDWNLNFNLGNAVKYLSRAGRKDDIIQDLLKAKQYIDFEIEALTNP